MYQHHILLKTEDPISGSQVSAWYETIKQFGPEDIVFPYLYRGKEIAVEYGYYHNDQMEHAYIVPLKRDLSQEETSFIVEAWDYMFEPDFDIEISNTYDVMGMGEFENTLEIDEEVKSQAVSDINKWRHNRWVEQMTAEGWHYGTYFNSTEKSHPALRNWDDLTESHRRSSQVSDSEIFDWLKTRGVI